jgi:hypothetical protein
VKIAAVRNVAIGFAEMKFAGTVMAGLVPRLSGTVCA